MGKLAVFFSEKLTLFQYVNFPCGYRKMHLDHLGDFKVQTPTKDDGDALLLCGADIALKGSH